MFGPIAVGRKAKVIGGAKCLSLLKGSLYL